MSNPNGNLTCDICEYIHPKPDKYGIVIECADGVLRCKVCRGDRDIKRKRVKAEVKAEVKACQR